MIQLLLLLISIALLIITVAKIRSLPQPQKKWLYIQIAIGICGVSLLFILMTGRIHWLGIIGGALIPILKAFLVKPIRNDEPQSQSETTADHSSQPPAAQAAMAVKEALDILGLEGDIASGEITAELVIDTHRKLIQKFHPDRGGNDYLAAKINQAKDVLLDALAKV